MDIFYKIASDLVIFLHFLWIAFLILGFPVILYLNLPKWRIFHLLALIAMIIMQITHTICPLTYVEVYLKSRGTSGDVYPGQFLIEAIEMLIYIDDVNLEKITYATAIFIVLVLISFWLRPIVFTFSKKTYEKIR